MLSHMPIEMETAKTFHGWVYSLENRKKDKGEVHMPGQAFFSQALFPQLGGTKMAQPLLALAIRPRHYVLEAKTCIILTRL